MAKNCGRTIKESRQNKIGSHMLVLHQKKCLIFQDVIRMQGTVYQSLRMHLIFSKHSNLSRTWCGDEPSLSPSAKIRAKPSSFVRDDKRPIELAVNHV